MTDPDAIALAKRYGDERGVEVSGAGCEDCNGSGVKGRRAIYELILVDRAVREAMHERDVERLRDAVKHQSQYMSLGAAAAALAHEGEISYREATRAVSEL